jgi:hypothetical protein
MPILYASLLASVAGYLFDDLLGRHLPLVLRVLANLIVSAAAFYYTRRFFVQLKEDMHG